VLLVPGDAVALDQGDEVGRRVAGEGGAAEVRIRRVEVPCIDRGVGEVAAAAARDADLLADALGVIDGDDAQAALRGEGRGEEPRRAGA
jgi:hypothetical protein